MLRNSTFFPFLRNVFNDVKCDYLDFSGLVELKNIYILNQKRNFRKIGLRGGHTRYERKKKSTPTSNETEISNEINDFQTVHELWWIDFQSLCNNKYE